MQQTPFAFIAICFVACGTLGGLLVLTHWVYPKYFGDRQAHIDSDNNDKDRDKDKGKGKGKGRGADTGGDEDGDRELTIGRWIKLVLNSYVDACATCGVNWRQQVSQAACPEQEGSTDSANLATDHCQSPKLGLEDSAAEEMQLAQLLQEVLQEVEQEGKHEEQGARDDKATRLQCFLTAVANARERLLEETGNLVSGPAA